MAAGSNLGAGGKSREDFLREAERELRGMSDVAKVVASSVHETEPLGRQDQPKYLNQVFVLQTWIEPPALLAALLAIERRLGRERAPGEKWEPRTIDLDLVLYGERVVNEPGLTVPHPHMHERRFVLAPLAEVAPYARHPVLKKTVRELLDALPQGVP